jgi:hypothetical protein
MGYENDIKFTTSDILHRCSKLNRVGKKYGRKEEDKGTKRKKRRERG